MRAKRTSLVHIIYFSRLNLSSDPAKRSEQIGEIGRTAQKKNEFAVITSFLYSHFVVGSDLAPLTAQ